MIELKRNCELVICSLLKEALSDLTFLSAKGGGDELTANWQANHNYQLRDVLRPTNQALQYAIVVKAAGNSGSTEPAFDDTPGSTFTGPPNYETTPYPAIMTKEDVGAPLPPFAVVKIDEAEKVLEQEETNRMEGVVVWVTDFDSTNVVDHSTDFKRIYDAVCQIGSGYDIMRRIMVHGLSVVSTNEFTDEERSAHGDAISFIFAASEM